MNQKEIAIDNIIISNKISKESFIDNPKFKSAVHDRRFTSAPNTVMCMNHMFMATVLWGETSISTIKLTPIMYGIKDPGYPDRTYQEAKWNYCKKILENHYGSEGILQTRSYGEFFGYRFPNYTIATAKITGGQAQYTGGDIIITFRSEIRR